MDDQVFEENEELVGAVALIEEKRIDSKEGENIEAEEGGNIEENHLIEEGENINEAEEGGNIEEQNLIEEVEKDDGGGCVKLKISDEERRIRYIQAQRQVLRMTRENFKRAKLLHGRLPIPSSEEIFHKNQLALNILDYFARNLPDDPLLLNHRNIHQNGPSHDFNIRQNNSQRNINPCPIVHPNAYQYEAQALAYEGREINPMVLPFEAFDPVHFNSELANFGHFNSMSLNPEHLDYGAAECRPSLAASNSLQNDFNSISTNLPLINFIPPTSPQLDSGESDFGYFNWRTSNSRHVNWEGLNLFYHHSEESRAGSFNSGEFNSLASTFETSYNSGEPNPEFLSSGELNPRTFNSECSQCGGALNSGSLNHRHCSFIHSSPELYYLETLKIKEYNSESENTEHCNFRPSNGEQCNLGPNFPSEYNSRSVNGRRYDVNPSNIEYYNSGQFNLEQGNLRAVNERDYGKSMQPTADYDPLAVGQRRPRTVNNGHFVEERGINNYYQRERTRRNGLNLARTVNIGLDDFGRGLQHLSLPRTLDRMLNIDESRPPFREGTSNIRSNSDSSFSCFDRTQRQSNPRIPSDSTRSFVNEPFLSLNKTWHDTSPAGEERVLQSDSTGAKPKVVSRFTEPCLLNGLSTGEQNSSTNFGTVSVSEENESKSNSKKKKNLRKSYRK